jgi:hypothetical protein
VDWGRDVLLREAAEEAAMDPRRDIVVLCAEFLDIFQVEVSWDEDKNMQWQLFFAPIPSPYFCHILKERKGCTHSLRISHHRRRAAITAVRVVLLLAVQRQSRPRAAPADMPSIHPLRRQMLELQSESLRIL